MQKTLLLFFFQILLIGGLAAQIESVGLIGTATPGGWDLDTNMVQDADSAHIWTLKLNLVKGAAKFRANDLWDVNWGSNTFPFGVGTQGGPDIMVPADGEYNVTLNTNTGDYYFEITSPIGIIGSALPFMWDKDVNMIPDTAAEPNPNMFFVTLDLAQGAAKFRKDDDWPVNWGSEDFPSGIGVQDGSDIPVAKAGNYTITLDTMSGAYNFEENVSFSTVGIIGDGTSLGFATDTAIAMIADGSNAGQWSLSTEISEGGIQFSGNNGEVIWGGTDFPMGTATENGDTIPVPAGRWLINFNVNTGAYNFTEVQIFNTVGIIGDATPGGWEADTDMERSESDSSQWELRLVLTDGFAKFRAENDWPINWGAGDFPSGVATRDGADIPVTAGEYIVSFNSLSGAYNFKELVVFDTIGLIGTATPFGNWDDDVLMTKDTFCLNPDGSERFCDENRWFLESIDLSQDGEMKFRANQDWTFNWGAVDFPNGIGTQDGPNIIVTAAGTYGIVLNTLTGEYWIREPFTLDGADSPLSSKELLSPSDIKAFPNPTMNTLNLDLSAAKMKGMLHLKVYNMSGSLMLERQQLAQDNIQLDVANLTNGQYILQIYNEKAIVGKRFMIVGKN